MICFKVNYISDNVVEEFENIVIDMNNLCISNNFSKILNNIFYETKPKYDYLLNCSVDFLEGFKKAVKQIESISKLKANNFVNTSVKDKEMERINEYYQSLKIEAEKRMKRKNLSQEKINEYKHKIKLYDIEKDRQLLF